MNTAPKLLPAQDFLAESPLMQTPEVSVLMKSILEEKLNFNKLEKEFFKILASHFLNLLSSLLQYLDNMLLYSVERIGWEVAGIHDRAIVCSLGELVYRRRYYKKKTINGRWVYAYLLDELLGIPKGATISPRLAELAVELAADKTYRKAAGAIESLLGVAISHESIRQEVIAAGEHLKKWDEPTALDETGKREVPFLIIEADGAQIRWQQRGFVRKKRKKNKSFELKTAVVYEGWEIEAPGAKRNKLKNPIYFVHGGSGEEFWSALERHLSRIYALDSCTRVIIGGDGSSWVREGIDYFEAEYQYCRFHLKRDLTSLFGQNPEIKKALELTFAKGDREAFNLIIETLINEEKEGNRAEELLNFQGLMNNVWEGIVDWRNRSGPKPELAGGLGAIEPNVGHTIARRFKHIGASWSVLGANSLAKVRCAVRNGNLIGLLRTPSPPKPLEDKSKIAEKVELSYWAKRKIDGKKGLKNPGEWCQASLPAVRGPEQTMRDFTRLISHLTTEWLY